MNNFPPTPPNQIASNPNKSKVSEHYKVIELLGKGSYGSAYLVEGETTHQKYVIKTIDISTMSDKEKSETQKEAQILQKLDHPNIIKCKEFFISQKPTLTLNIVTEYADGGDLSLTIKKQPKKELIPESTILDYFTQICLSIKHIHDKHIIHRDLKSQNIFLTKGGLVKLGDFGIAKCLQHTYQNAKTMIGTPYYLSPEIVQGKPYSFKSDIWSLGVMLYEMMALKMPFDATNLPMLSLKIMKGQYAPLSTRYTEDLRKLVKGLLCTDPAKRPSVKDILQMPLIKNRIRNFLNEIQYNKEFSTTIVKNYKQEKRNKKENSLSTASTQATVEESKSSNIQKPQSSYNKLRRPPSNHIKIINSNNNNNVQTNKHHVDVNINSHNKNNSNNNNNNVLPKPQSSSSNSNNKKIDSNKIRSAPPTDNNTPQTNKHSSNNSNNKHINNKHQDDLNKPHHNISTKEQIPLSKVMEQGRLNKRNTNSGKDFDIIWADENKAKNRKQTDSNHNLPKNNFPSIIIVDKKPTDDRQKEEQYNQHRYFNFLNEVQNETKDDSDNQSEDDNNNNNNNNGCVSVDPIKEVVDQREVFLNNISNEQCSTVNDTNCGSANTFSDFSEIEEIKARLEEKLGFELLKEVYDHVDMITDHHTVRFDYEKIEELKMKLEDRYTVDQINTAVDSVEEVFSIVVKERL